MEFNRLYVGCTGCRWYGIITIPKDDTFIDSSYYHLFSSHACPDCRELSLVKMADPLEHWRELMHVDAIDCFASQCLSDNPGTNIPKAIV